MAIDRDPPDSARCVIIGGGVGGVSIAYHLAELGYEDVVLVERSQLTSGSTFHSAGLVGQLRGSVSLTKMMMHSVELYRRIGDESEFDPGWVECGGIRLASTEERMEELRRQAGWAKTFGLPLELISADEAKEMFPLMSTEGVLGAAFLPTDGYLDPSQLTYAMADGARRGGAKIFTSTRVTGIEVKDERVKAVETDRGRIECEVVVNASGMYAAEIGRLAGVRVPVIPMSHQYVVTQPVRERSDGERLPTLRDPDLLVYYREDGEGLVMGGYEHDSKPAFLPDGTGGFDEIPPDFNGRLLEDEPDRFEEIAENSKIRVPAMKDAKITKLINGPEAFTPDNEFCLGETEVAGFFVAAGFCAHGLAGAGGIGKVMAEWISDGEPSLDLWHMDVRRFGAHYRSPAYTHARIRETYETYYDIRYPNHEREAGRPLRVSTANGWHAEHGAAFGEKSGWERVNWYESNAERGDESLRPRGWAGMHWSPAIGAEHLATRESAAIFDESSFAKMEISGPGAAEFVEGPLRQPRRARDRPDHLHADAEQPRRHRVRLHRRPPGGGPLLDRHRNRVRAPRPQLDQPPPAARRLRPGPRRHLGLRVLRHLGPARPRHPAAAGAARPRKRRVPLHDAPGPDGRPRAGAGAASDLRRRAGLGALLPDRVRARPVARAVGGGRAPRDGRGRLPRDRLDAGREGLPRLGRRHHAGRDALRGKRRLLREARQGGRLQGPRGAPRGEGAKGRERASSRSSSRTHDRSRSATSRSGSTARSAAA